MADTSVAITAGSGTNVDTRTEGTNGNHRQVVVLGDPSTNAGVAPVDGTSGLKVDLGTDNDVTVSGTVTVDLGVNNDVTVTSGSITETNSAAIKTAVEIIDNAIAGSEMQVDVITMPTTTVQATDLDIRNLVNTDVVTAELSAVDNAVLDTIAAKDFATQTTLAAINTKLASGTVIGDVNLGATDNAVLDAIASSTAAIETAVEGTLTVTGGGGGTEYTEDTASAANPVGNAMILVRDDSRSGGLTTTDGDNVAARGNNNGEQYVIDTDANTKLTSITGVLESVDANTINISTGIDVIAGSVSGTEMQVDVLTMPTVAVTQSGTWDEVGINDSGNSITVDAPVGTPAYVRLSDGASAISTLPVSLASVPSHAVTNAGTFVTQENGALLTAVQLIDDTIFSDDAAVTLGTSKGSVLAGVAVQTDGTDPSAVSAEGDAAAIRTDMNRLMIVNQTHPRFWHVSADYASAQTNASVKTAPGASLSLYITDIQVSNGATAGNITLLDGSGGTVLYELYPAINGGAVLSLRSPIKLTGNTALCITSTTVTTHSLFVSGYIAP